MTENPYESPKELNIAQEAEEADWRYYLQYALWSLVGIAVLFGLVFGILWALVALGSQAWPVKD